MKEGAAFGPKIDLQQVYDDIVKSAEIAEVPFREDVTWAVLNTYKDFFSGSPVNFRTTTKSKEKRGLNVRYIEIGVLHDPFKIALDAGLIKKEGHPAESLLVEAQERFPMDGYGGYGIDFGVDYGFEKIWPVFNGPQPISEVFKMPSLPDSAKAHADYFAKHDLSGVGLLAVDYRSKSMNLYFYTNDIKDFSVKNVADLAKDLDFTLPSQEVMEHCARTPAIYFTFTWDSPRVERLCFCTHGTPDTVPVHWSPVIEKYVADAPFLSPQRSFFYNITLARGGDYVKIENDYKGTMGYLLAQAAQLVA